MEAEVSLENLDILRKIEGLCRERIHYNNVYKGNIIHMGKKGNQNSNSTQNPVCLSKEDCFVDRIKADPRSQIHQICELPIYYNFESLHPDEGYVECTLPKHRNQLPNHLKNYDCNCMQLSNHPGIKRPICKDTFKNKAL